MEKDGDISDKVAFHLSLILKALEYKEDVPKMYQFIKINSKYFPSVTPEQLEQLKESADNVVKNKPN